jgi:hypothetical protein
VRTPFFLPSPIGFLKSQQKKRPKQHLQALTIKILLFCNDLLGKSGFMNVQGGIKSEPIGILIIHGKSGNMPLQKTQINQ